MPEEISVVGFDNLMISDLMNFTFDIPQRTGPKCLPIIIK